MQRVPRLVETSEEAVYAEFLLRSERGGVSGAMETMKEPGRIQDESLHHETLKASGELPIIGVDTLVGHDGSPIHVLREVMRSSDDDQ